MTYHRPLHIAIIGSGIGGLSLAIGLTQYPHITYTLYESHPSYAEIGAGIGFHSNGHESMALLSPELFHRYQEKASFNGTLEKRGTAFNYEVGEKGENEGKRIVEVPLPEGMQQSTIHRRHLLEILKSCLNRDCTEFGMRLVDVEQKVDSDPDKSGGKKVVAIFADGTRVEADAVIGCDGNKSVCRKLVFGKDSELSKPIFTGKVAYRGLVPMDSAVEILGEDKAMNRQMYLGHHGHMLTFAVARGQFMNVVAFHDTGKNEWEGEQWVKSVKKEDFLRDFEGWGKNVTGIIEV